jgi:hypothetical protein
MMGNGRLLHGRKRRKPKTQAIDIPYFFDHQLSPIRYLAPANLMPDSHRHHFKSTKPVRLAVNP